MNINLNNNITRFFSFEIPINSRYKPIIYAVSTIAISILIYKCYRYINNSNFFQMRVMPVTSFLKKDMEDIPESEETNISLGRITGGKSEMQQEEITFQQLLKNSAEFVRKSVDFRTEDNLIKNFATTAELQDEVVEHAKATHPVLHSRVWSFIPKFLEHKRKYGSSIEKKMYQDLTPTQFVDRLIKKRPLVFCDKSDNYLLQNGRIGQGGFETIGTNEEHGEFCLENYQSYFEMSLSAFLSVFTPTHFINDGNRHNHGVSAPEGTYEPKGIYVGMVGARFEKKELMEWPHMVVTDSQNTAANGYGSFADPDDPKTIELRLWAELYQSRLGDGYAFPDFEEAQRDTTERYLKIGPKAFLDTFVYKERLKFVIESFLLESNKLAKKQGKEAYLHVVGLGLGVWMLNEHQTNLMLDVYAELLSKHKLEHVSDINFSWFKAQKCGHVSNEETFDSQGHPIKIHFSKRNPAEKLQGEDEGKLLIAQYAWDSNAYPGNEYWTGGLNASGDPAAACCSTIVELQNPDINPQVQAKSLTIVSP